MGISWNITCMISIMKNKYPGTIFFHSFHRLAKSSKALKICFIMNFSKNLSTVKDDQTLWTPAKILYNTVLLVISLVNLFTCIVFLVAYMKFKNLRKNKFTFFIFHMSIADIFNILMFILNLLLDDLKMLNNRFVCSSMEYLYYLSFDVSYYISLFLALERYCSIIKPLHYSLITSKSFMYKYLISVWLLSSIALLFMFFVFSKWKGACISYEILSDAAHIIVYLFGTGIMSIIACALYGKVAYAIYQRKYNKILISKNNTLDQKNEEKKNFNSVVFICSLAVILEICRIPYLVCTYLLLRRYSNKVFAIYQASIALVLIKPMLSFIVYSIKFKEIRNLVKVILSFGRWKTSQNPVILLNSVTARRTVM